MSPWEALDQIEIVKPVRDPVVASEDSFRWIACSSVRHVFTQNSASDRIGERATLDRKKLSTETNHLLRFYKMPMAH